MKAHVGVAASLLLPLPFVHNSPSFCPLSPSNAFDSVDVGDEKVVREKILGEDSPR
jgi:hypothetical protein